MATVGLGVIEIRIHVGTEYQVFYLARFEEAIYVLRLFSKKTRKSSPLDIELGTRRYREVLKRRKECEPHTAMRMFFSIADFRPPKLKIFGSAQR